LLHLTKEVDRIEPGKDVLAQANVTADSGFHSQAVLAAVERTGANAYIADRDYRRRDPICFRSFRRSALLVVRVGGYSSLLLTWPSLRSPTRAGVERGGGA
jgi:hypothetical protein